MKVPGPRRQRRDLRAGVGWWWWAVARIHASPGPLLITDPAPRDILPRGGALSKQPWFPKGVYPKAIQLLYSEPAFSRLLVPGPQLRSKWVEPSGGLNSPPREQDLSRDQESDAQPAEPPRPPPPKGILDPRSRCAPAPSPGPDVAYRGGQLSRATSPQRAAGKPVTPADPGRCPPATHYCT